MYTHALTHAHPANFAALECSKKVDWFRWVDIVFSSVPFTIYASTRFGTRWLHAFVLIFFRPELGNGDWKMVAQRSKYSLLCARIGEYF